MPTLVFDIRANHDTGVSRYGLDVLAATAPLLDNAGWRQIVVIQPRQQDRARRAVLRTGASVMCCPDEDGFVRRSAWLRDMVRREHADLYYTSHYSVDRECAVPFVFTIHDLTRLRYPQWSYTDESFAERFGAAELDVVRAELIALGQWDQPVAGEATFTRYFRALNRYLIQRAEHIVSVSEATAADIQGILGMPRDRLAHVPCLVNTSVFRRRDRAEVQAIRTKYRIPGPFLLFVGLTHPHKRLPWLAASLLQHRDRFPAGSCLVAVGGYAERSPEVAALLAQAGAADFVRCPGRVSDDELATLYSAASAVVSASLSEGSSLPPQEAMACGCQVIATDIPAHRETLGDCATLYPPDRADLLGEYAALALAGRLPDRASRFRPASRALAGERLFRALTRALAASTGQTRRRAAAGRSGQRWLANAPVEHGPDRLPVEHWPANPPAPRPWATTAATGTAPTATGTGTSANGTVNGASTDTADTADAAATAHRPAGPERGRDPELGVDTVPNGDGSAKLPAA
jgi:glycosyltransferase involved in cell wall biosynthesis